MVGPTGRFRRRDRLVRAAEFGRVGREGRRAVDPAFVLLAAAARSGGVTPARRRLGITVSRKVGSAVVRNRVKRRVREWFRKCRPQLVSGLELVVIGRSQAAGLSGRDIERILCRLARAAGAAAS